MSWKKELGRQIKQERESAGFTQSELADRLKVTRQMIGRYETGRDAPAIEVLAELVRFFGVEFRVAGVRLELEEDTKRPRPVPKQLKLEFEKTRTYEHVQVEITPREGRILIKADIPA